MNKHLLIKYIDTGNLSVCNKSLIDWATGSKNIEIVGHVESELSASEIKQGLTGSMDKRTRNYSGAINEMIPWATSLLNGLKDVCPNESVLIAEAQDILNKLSSASRY